MRVKYKKERSLSTIKLLAFYTLATAILLSGCTTGSAKGFPTASNDYSTLKWKSCHGSFQCATLKVPIDYLNPSLGQFDIAILRYRAANQQNRIGALVVNPGGPGVSGIKYALNAEYSINPKTLERYDIVGFDPRGIAESSPIHCLTAAEQDRFLASDPKPDNQAQFAQSLLDSQSFVDKCVAKTRNLAHFSTYEAAHDMELLRLGLGEKKLNYLGFSYGTYLGTLYAEQFPENVGRFVLDGAINPAISNEEQSILQAVAFDKALANFIADCPKHSDCPLPENATSAFFINFFKRVAKKPLIVQTSQLVQQTSYKLAKRLSDQSVDQSKREITEGLVVTGTASALYDDVSGWPLLRRAITQGLSGDGSGFAKLADSYNGRNSDGTYSDNQNDANIVIDCLDWQNKLSNDVIRADAIHFAKEAPVFGPYVAYSAITCNFLKKSIHYPDPKNNKLVLNTATPVIIIGTTHDPATPYAWAKALSTYFIGSRLVTLQGEGHTGYARGSACIDDAVDTYLVTGAIPAQNLICKQ